MSFLFFTSMTIIALSICFTRMFHPLAMGGTLLVQTIMVCITSGLSNKSMWFSYILFLIFLGAMLVLFIYVASLASNESFQLSPYLSLLIMAAALIGSMAVILDPLLPALKLSPEGSFFSFESSFLSPQANLSLIYNPSSMNLTLFIILYLLLTLIVVVKITSTFFGPLRLS
uniref:NADH-ubiquinone oxidoreductase chain 6 n=1 Tax=Notostomus gibbosus TaxID=727943 RepID=A0A8A6KI09_9EUCA|nr:NADH dehydrogenase subunit 6 [Notostomus gibbosus]QTI83237.1 NADH dehydrogenase subunit 6 [Notostomus gibbosus]